MASQPGGQRVLQYRCMCFGDGRFYLEHANTRQVDHESCMYMSDYSGLWVGLTGRPSLEVAFANYRFWMSSGMAFGFFITRFVTVNSYLAISFVLLMIGVFCYFLIELLNPIVVRLIIYNVLTQHA